MPVIVIRSVGPAGGPVTALSQDTGQLTVNHRWALVPPRSCGHYVGDENQPGWMTAQSAATSWSGEAGWGYARIAFAASSAKAGEEIRLVLSDLQPPVEMERSYRDAPKRARLALPDPRMQASMNAQISHLMMSLVDDETRPAIRPCSIAPGIGRGLYHGGAGPCRRSQSRPGALAVLATHDFAGGSGPEADAPGLAIWALTESAGYIADPVHDDWLWPHLLRKVGRIEEMMAARSPIVESYTVPAPHDFQHLRQTRTAVLAQPARDGVIVGRVGEDWPVRYVNAVSYRGLLAAAEFAERFGKRHYAARWRTEAQSLQESWMRQFPDGTQDGGASPTGLRSLVGSALRSISWASRW